MTIISILISILTIFIISRIFFRIKDKNLSVSMGLFWIMSWITIAVVTFFPQITTNFSELIGIGRGVDAAFFITLLFLSYIIFRLYVKIDNLDKNMTELTINITKKFHKNKK